MLREIKFNRMAIGCWSIPDTTGETPKPCGAVSFTKVDQHTAVLFGGRQKQGRVNDLVILNMEKWVKKMIFTNKLYIRICAEG